MAGYITDIENKSIINENFREVLFTASRQQLVVMSLRPGEDIGEETHEEVDQFIHIEAGLARAVLEGEEHDLTDGSVVVIPAGTRHNIINTSESEPLKLYTIYSPPPYSDGTVHRTKAEATKDEKLHQ